MRYLLFKFLRAGFSLVRRSHGRACNACPAVELDLDEHEVRVGEHGNQVRLTSTEWNVLAPAIRNGEVGELDTDEGS